MGILIELLFNILLEVPIVRGIILSVIPSYFLLRWIRSKDYMEPEPPELIWKLAALGGLSVGLSFLLEMGLLYVLTRTISQDQFIFTLIKWFVVVGLAEEGCKFLMLRLCTWKDENFNCLYDGLLYSVAVSAGFAVIENIIYLIRYGNFTVLLRGITSVPAHICFAIFMGTWYSAAKKYEIAGDVRRKKTSLTLAIVVPALMHGLFDLLADLASTGAAVVFYLAVIVMFVVSWRQLKKMAESDAFLDGSPLAKILFPKFYESHPTVKSEGSEKNEAAEDARRS